MASTRLPNLSFFGLRPGDRFLQVTQQKFFGKQVAVRTAAGTGPAVQTAVAVALAAKAVAALDPLLQGVRVYSQAGVLPDRNLLGIQ